jgi:hypothetical protein
VLPCVTAATDAATFRPALPSTLIGCSAKANVGTVFVDGPETTLADTVGAGKQTHLFRSNLHRAQIF